MVITPVRQMTPIDAQKKADMELFRQREQAVRAYKSQLQEYIATNRAQPTSRDLTNLYATSVTAFAAANFWGDNMAAVKFCPYDKNGIKLPEDSDHPLARMLYSPRFSEVMRRIVITDLFWGRNLLEKQRNLLGTPVALRWINPNLYSLDTTSSEGLKGFRIYPGRYRVESTHYLKYRDAVYFHSFDFDDDFDGTSAAEVAFLESATEPEIGQTYLAFFRNMAIPAAIVQPKEKATAEHKADKPSLTAFLRRTFQGSVNVGRTLVTATMWEWIQLQMPFKDLLMKDIKLDLRESTAMAFGVSIEFLVTGQTTFAELEGKIALWEDKKLKPRANWYADRITEDMQNEPAFRGYSIQPDFEEIIEEDEGEKLDLIERKKNSTLISLAKAQELAGETVEPAFTDLYIVEGVPLPKAEVGNYYKYKFAIPPEPLPEPPAIGEVVEPVIATEVPAPETPPAAPDAEASADTTSLCVMLGLGAQADLIGLQNLLKERLADKSIEWKVPDTFHVTLVYAPAATPEQVQALKAALAEVEVPELKLAIGSFASFDNVGQHALHFRLRRNHDLLDTQEMVYGLCEQLGIAVNSYGDPGQYKPHVTMGTASEKVRVVPFASRLKVTPKSLQLSDDSGIIDERSLIAEEEEDEIPEEPKGGKSESWLPDDVFGEIKVAARKGVGFVPKLIDEHTAKYIAVLHEQQISYDDIFKAAKSFHLSVRAAKSIQSTRLDFEGEYDDLLASARAKQIDRRRAGTILRDILRRYTDKAFIDGLVDGGVDEAEVDEDDRAKLKAFQSEQSGFVSGLTEVLFNGSGISDGQAAAKSSQWFNGSVYPAYVLGLQSAAGNMMMRWDMDTSKENCRTCKMLDGQIHRLSAFIKNGFFPNSSKLICGRGKKCGCRFSPAAGKANGSLKSVPKARKHVHQDEETVA